MNSHTFVGVKWWSVGLVTASVDGESQSSKEVMSLLTDSSERYTSGLFSLLFKWKSDRKWGCNRATR